MTANADSRTLAGDAGIDDQLDRVILENGLFAGLKQGLGIDVAVGFDQFRFLGVDSDQFGSGTQHELGLAIDVSVVEADDGKAECGVFAHFGFPVGFLNGFSNLGPRMKQTSADYSGETDTVYPLMNHDSVGATLGFAHMIHSP